MSAFAGGAPAMKAVLRATAIAMTPKACLVLKNRIVFPLSPEPSPCEPRPRPNN